MTQEIVPLGRLTAVQDIRTVWPGEATHFTPWLAQAENIGLLGEAIGLELEVESQEVSVGPFSADILCKDTVTGHYVVIENQIERTDHGHLGQLLTYAAGLDAVSIVWIARRFADEHRAALDWLNRITAESINFFGVEIEVWRIGDSAMAPKFNVVCQPNDWAKAVKQSASTNAGGTTEFQRLHLEFWTQFRQFMEERQSTVKTGRPSTDSWTDVAVGRSNFTIALSNAMRDGYSKIFLVISGADKSASFENLRANHQREIEQSLGPVEWRDGPERKQAQISLRRNTTPTDPTTWPELNEWFAAAVERWVKVLRPIIKNLDASEFRESTSVELGDAVVGNDD